MTRPSNFLAIALVVVAACSDRRESTPVPSCELFERLARGEHVEVPSDPAVFWTQFEECKAKGQSLCERAWTLLLAQPTMASPTPAQLAQQEAEYVKACAALPEQVQRCLTAYGIAHEKECAPLRAPEQLREMERKQRGH
jgi:hypothetical protein